MDSSKDMRPTLLVNVWGEEPPRPDTVVHLVGGVSCGLLLGKSESIYEEDGDCACATADRPSVHVVAVAHSGNKTELNCQAERADVEERLRPRQCER